MPIDRWLEFHDSKVIAVHCDSARAHLDLDGYIHQWEDVGASRRGTGWIQRVRLELDTPTVVRLIHTLPASLWDGRALSRGLPQDEEGTLTVPIFVDDSTELELEATSGEKLKISGKRLRASTSGEPRFLEEIPLSMDPERASD